MAIKPFNYQQDFSSIDFRQQSELYQVGRGDDPIKAAAATVFKGWWDKIRQDEDYLKRKRQHQARWG
ncbi:DUF4385 domain-containing protein [Salmonella enterica]|nr:DUF4385 domain-containing protein [Salmonella enterica]